MGWVVNATPQPLYSPRKRPGTGGWVGLRAGLNECGKISPPPGFDPLTAQPLASLYTDYAFPAREETTTTDKITSSLLYLKWVFTS